jgi:hypothetical protein
MLNLVEEISEAASTASSTGGLAIFGAKHLRGIKP